MHIMMKNALMGLLKLMNQQIKSKETTKMLSLCLNMTRTKETMTLLKNISSNNQKPCLMM
jgi:hypothetical protein